MTTSLTSITHPLRVDFVDVPAGRLGMTFAPGKFQPYANAGRWERDLALDLQRLQAVYGADVLVSIIETHELTELRIPDLGAAAGARGIEWIHVSVVDGQVPVDDAPWVAAMHTVRARLLDGRTVVVHCKGGLGRTGTFVASILTTYGIAPVDATVAVRASRAKTIETPAQALYVATAYAAWRESEAARGLTAR